MKFKTLAVVAVLCLSVFSCSEKNNSSPEVNSGIVMNTGNYDSDTIHLPESQKAMEQNFKDVPDSENGPLISVGNITAKAGEIAEVKVYVEGADLNWSSCGIHLTYPDILQCVYREDDNMFLKYKAGVASEFNTGIVAMEWKKESTPPAELTEKGLGTMFFTVMFSGNEGQDGEILTLYLKVPEDAESGTVYPIGFYYLATDMFRNTNNDSSFEKYAFEHMKAGTITVE